jgi:hypothetical protein
MKNNKIIDELIKALDPTNDLSCYYDPLTSEISNEKKNGNWIYIEPLSDEIFSCISDFIYETEDEFLEKEMNNAIKSRTPLKSFLNFLTGKKKLTKYWNQHKNKWLKQQAFDFLDDVEN